MESSTGFPRRSDPNQQQPADRFGRSGANVPVFRQKRYDQHSSACRKCTNRRLVDVQMVRIQPVSSSVRAECAQSPPPEPGGRPRLRSSSWFLISVRHRIDNIVHSDANSEIGEFCGITRVVPCSRIARSNVEAHGHHDTAPVVVNGSPVRYFAILQNLGGISMRAGHLVAMSRS